MESAISVHPTSLEAVSTVSPFPLNGTERNPLLFGCSEKMRQIQRIIDQVANTDITVLVRGESGTGKELVAREICMRSARRDKPFQGKTGRGDPGSREAHRHKRQHVVSPIRGIRIGYYVHTKTTKAVIPFHCGRNNFTLTARPYEDGFPRDKCSRSSEK